MKYVMKPVIVDAVQLTWENLGEVCEFFEKSGIIMRGVFNDKEPDTLSITIPSLGGNTIATKGDWIIRNAEGEIYSCKPDVFITLYKEVTDELA